MNSENREDATEERIAEVKRSYRWVRWALVVPASRLFARWVVKQPRRRQIALTPFKVFGVLETESARVDPREVMRRALLRIQEITPVAQGIKAQPVSSRGRFAARPIVGPQGILLGGRHLDPVLPVVTVTCAPAGRYETGLSPGSHTFSGWLFPERLDFNRLPVTLDLRNTR